MPIYLVWLGVQAIRHRHDFHVETATELAGPRVPLVRAIRQGFVVGVTNPKAFMILGAVLPQFVDRGVGHVQMQMFLLGLLAFTIGLLSDSLWALIASQLRLWFARSRRRGEAVGTRRGHVDDRPRRRSRRRRRVPASPADRRAGWRSSRR